MPRKQQVARVDSSKVLAIRRGSTQTCKIVIEPGVFSSKSGIRRILSDLLREQPSRVAAITDSNVKRLYGVEIAEAIGNFGKSNLITIQAGERSKTLASCSRILSKLADFGLDRDSLIILIGGGVVGDLGAFVSSIYKRGLKYVQIPTTLLSQVDSSIGGKTAVNTPWGKNQIGTIYQPKGVVIDPNFLTTLPKTEILNGLGEIVKYGIVASPEIFGVLEKEEGLSPRIIKELIVPCCKIKASLVSRDEFDRGIRTILNYGHTVAHALETASNYKLGHGVAILIGMVCEGWMGEELQIFELADFERQQHLIKRILIEKMGTTSWRLQDSEKIAELASRDKKNSGGKLMVVLPEKIGRMHRDNNGSFKLEVSRKLLKRSVEYAKNSLSF